MDELAETASFLGLINFWFEFNCKFQRFACANYKRNIWIIAILFVYDRFWIDFTGSFQKIICFGWIIAWQMCRRMQTNRKLKCPIDKRKSACNFIEPELTGFVMFADIFFCVSVDVRICTNWIFQHSWCALMRIEWVCVHIYFFISIHSLISLYLIKELIGDWKKISIYTYKM